MWVSLIWAKLKLAGSDWASAAPIARDESTPPATDQSSPVPVHAMHRKNPRRSTPRRSFMIRS
jgi:hypothetical protein